MAKNIYDLFNERKYGVDYLVEGVDGTFEEVEAFDSLEEAADYLEFITQESANDSIELQAAWHLEDLVIENMMFDDFEEDRILNIMEGAMKEKMNKASEYIKKKWQQIKEWFASTFKAIANHFMSGEKFVEKYKKEIPTAMKNCQAKIKAPDMTGPIEANDRCHAMIQSLKLSRIHGENGHEQVLKLIGVDDRKNVAKKVKDVYFPSEPKERTVKDFTRSPEAIMHWAGNRKKMVDDFKKQQKAVDDDFKEILGRLKNEAKDAGKEANEIVKNFNFALGIKNTILSTQLHCIKHASSICLQIIKKAIAKPGDGKDDYDRVDPGPDKRKLIGDPFMNSGGKSQRLKDKKNNAKGMAAADQAVEDHMKKHGKPETASFVPEFEAFEIYDEEDSDEWDW